MTTNMRCTYVDNVSVRNDTLFIGVDSAEKYSAVTWASNASGQILQVRVDCLHEVSIKLALARPEWSFWLVGGHSTLQPDSRIVRYNGFWKSLEKANVKIPTGEFLNDTVESDEAGVRFFGAVRLHTDQSASINAVMMAAQAAVVFLPNADGAEIMMSLLEKKWSATNVKPPREILETICGHSGIVVDVYGSFDDPEVLVAGIGRKEVLDDLSLN